MELQEIDKQAHKLLVAYILFNENSREMQPLQKSILPGKLSKALFLIIFAGLSLQTSKPPVFYKIRENREHYRQLTAYVLSGLSRFSHPLAHSGTE